MYRNSASHMDISIRRTTVPCSRIGVGTQQWRAFLCILNGFSGEFVDFWRDPAEVQDFPPHETVDDPKRCRIICRSTRNGS